jgi:hypothetical protein
LSSQWHPPGSSQRQLTLQASGAGQVTGVLTQPVAGSQVSVVQTLPSSQLIGVCTQPVAGSHVSLVQAL